MALSLFNRLASAAAAFTAPVSSTVSSSDVTDSNNVEVNGVKVNFNIGNVAVVDPEAVASTTNTSLDQVTVANVINAGARLANYNVGTTYTIYQLVNGNYEPVDADSKYVPGATYRVQNNVGTSGV